MNKKDVKRPELKAVVLNSIKQLEYFQNKTLRPVLKMQHPLLIALFKDYLEKRKIVFSKEKLIEQEKHIDAILSKDITYKNQQLGLIIGQLSLEEYSFYRKNSNEFNRRILQMLKKRLKDSVQELT